MARDSADSSADRSRTTSRTATADRSRTAIRRADEKPTRTRASAGADRSVGQVWTGMATLADSWPLLGDGQLYGVTIRPTIEG